MYFQTGQVLCREWAHPLLGTDHDHSLAQKTLWAHGAEVTNVLTHSVVSCMSQEIL